MFSYVDLVRTEIALEVGEHFGIAIPKEETDGWRSLGDIARSVVARAGGAGTETEVFGWIRGLVADGYGVTAELTPDEPVLADYDRMTGWFMAAPYPHHLGDRWFVRQRAGTPGGPDAAPGTSPAED
ncbi:MAG: acyl carrier protein [Zavarzinella sp.]